MIIEAFNGTRRATGMFQTCILTGSYGLRECAESVGAVVDIGANVGFFTVAARVLCPTAQVVAVEPDQATFGQLLQNAKHLRVQPVNVGLGTGAPLRHYEKPPRDRDCHGSRYDVDGNGSQEIRSVRLGQLTQTFQIEPSQVFIKVDCEGGERYLLGDAQAEQIIRQCVGIGGEFHPVRKGPSRNEFEGWLESLVADTHTLTFFQESPLGICEFRAVRIKRTKALQAMPTHLKRRVRILSDLKMYRGAMRWKKEEIAEIDYERASHMVCCRQAEYIIE